LVESKWELVRTDTFLSLYRSKNEGLKKKIKILIDRMAQSENPYEYGNKKRNLGFWAADISRSERLAFTLEGNKLLLLKVCDHKDVYGRG
jgi:Txe/YoeB family toxin of Txe-Axe toxin-antitoxin module